MESLKAGDAEEINQESPGTGELSAKQELALRAIISHPTLKEAALAAGVSDSTIWRYMQDEAFSKRLREARRDAVSHAVIRLQQASSDAVTVLHELMMKEDAPAVARITACRTVLDYSFRAAEMDELKVRVDELERFILRKQEENALDRALEGGGQ